MSALRKPVDVRVVYVDETEQSVDVAYDGSEDGMHRWTVVTPLWDKTPHGLRIGVLPERTEVSLGWPR